MGIKFCGSVLIYSLAQKCVNAGLGETAQMCICIVTPSSATDSEITQRLKRLTQNYEFRLHSLLSKCTSVNFWQNKLEISKTHMIEWPNVALKDLGIIRFKGTCDLIHRPSSA